MKIDKLLILLILTIFIVENGCKRRNGSKRTEEPVRGEISVEKQAAGVSIQSKTIGESDAEGAPLIREYSKILPVDTGIICSISKGETNRVLERISSAYNKIFRVVDKEHLEKKLDTLFGLKPPVSAECVFAAKDSTNFMVSCPGLSFNSEMARGHYVFHNMKMYYLDSIAKNLVLMFDEGKMFIGTRSFLTEVVKVKVGITPPLGRYRNETIDRISKIVPKVVSCYFISEEIPFIRAGSPRIKEGSLTIGERHLRALFELGADSTGNFYKWLTKELEAAKIEWEKELNELVESGGFLSMHELKLASSFITTARTSQRERAVIFEADEDPLPFLIIRYRSTISRILEAAQ